MQNYHESGRTFRELDNHEMLTGFMAELDPGMDYLLKDDIEFVQMRFGRTLRSVYLLKGDLQPAFEIFDLFTQRVKERTTWIEKRLERSFEFEQDEVFKQESTDAPAATGAIADQRWELKLKDEALSEMVRGRTEPEARATLATRYAKFSRQITTMDSMAVRERFFDGLLQAFDPHSGYFSADSTREFALEMMGAVAGAGLEIKYENGLNR
jgi:carboxyl-terminal processing protease